MSFQPETGELFAADVGWEMREMIYRVKRGANYGWSITEGSQPVKQNQQPKIPISPPLFRSLVFYRLLKSGRGHMPQCGDRWRLNLNRLEDNMAMKSQCSQGDRNIPRFHTPDFFGFVEFAD